MTWLQFFANIIQSLAWPVALVIIIFTLRKQLIALLHRIGEVTLPGGYKVTFHQALEDSRTAIEQIQTKPTEPERFLFRNFRANYSSESAWAPDILSQMLLAYEEVEKLLTELAMHHSLTGTHWATWRALEQNGVLSASAADAIENLRKARNALVHIPERQVTPLEAIEFVGQCKVLGEYLRSLIEKAPPKQGR